MTTGQMSLDTGNSLDPVVLDSGNCLDPVVENNQAVMRQRDILPQGYDQSTTNCRLRLENDTCAAASLSPLSCTSLTREIDAFYPRDDDSFSVEHTIDAAIEIEDELNEEAMSSREIVPSWMTRHSIKGACIPDIAKYIDTQSVLHLVARCGGKKSLRIRQQIIALDNKKEAKRHDIMVISARQVHATNMTSEFNAGGLDFKCYLDRKKGDRAFI